MSLILAFSFLYIFWPCNLHRYDNHENPLIDRKGQIAGYLNGTPNCVDEKTIDIYGWCHVKPCPRDGKITLRNYLSKRYQQNMQSIKTGGKGDKMNLFFVELTTKNRFVNYLCLHKCIASDIYNFEQYPFLEWLVELVKYSFQEKNQFRKVRRNWQILRVSKMRWTCQSKVFFLFCFFSCKSLFWQITNERRGHLSQVKKAHFSLSISNGDTNNGPKNQAFPGADGAPKI